MKTSLTLLLLCCTLGAIAQDELDSDEEIEIRRYSVEVIIFANEEDFASGTEIFVPDELPTGDLPDDFQELAPLARKTRHYELVMLTEDEFTLGEAYGRLQRLQAYDPLMHFGWTQPAYPDEEPQSRPLSSFATPPRGLQGDLTLYLSRYLHLAVNLQLDAEPAKAAREVSDSSEYRDNFYRQLDTSVATGPTRYRISEDRIFRNGELRYFDHPKFGALVKIARVEEETELDEDELFNTELLGE
jgi:hypothetical protein